MDVCRILDGRKTARKIWKEKNDQNINGLAIYCSCFIHISELCRRQVKLSTTLIIFHRFNFMLIGFVGRAIQGTGAGLYQTAGKISLH